MPLLMFLAFVVLPVVALLTRALARRDGLAVEAVSLDPAEFESGDLPGVCCKTGVPADVGVTVIERKWLLTQAEGIVPITNEQHQSFLVWRSINRRSAYAAFIGIVLLTPLDAVEAPLAVETVMTVLTFSLLTLPVVSNLIAQRYLADPHVERDGTVTLRGVHPAFVRAVQESRRDKRPAATADTP